MVQELRAKGKDYRTAIQTAAVWACNRYCRTITERAVEHYHDKFRLRVAQDAVSDRNAQQLRDADEVAQSLAQVGTVGTTPFRGTSMPLPAAIGLPMGLLGAQSPARVKGTTASGLKGLSRDALAEAIETARLRLADPGTGAKDVATLLSELTNTATTLASVLDDDEPEERGKAEHAESLEDDSQGH